MKRNMCKNQLLILFYFLLFDVDSICGQKNALYIKIVSSNSSLEERSLEGRNAHLSRKRLSAG